MKAKDIAKIYAPKFESVTEDNAANVILEVATSIAEILYRDMQEIVKIRNKNSKTIPASAILEMLDKSDAVAREFNKALDKTEGAQTRYRLKEGWFSQSEIGQRVKRERDAQEALSRLGVDARTAGYDMDKAFQRLNAIKEKGKS